MSAVVLDVPAEAGQNPVRGLALDQERVVAVGRARASRAARPAAPPRAPPARPAGRARRCRSRRRGRVRAPSARASRQPPRPRPTSCVSMAFVSVDVGVRVEAVDERAAVVAQPALDGEAPAVARVAREAGLEARPAAVGAHRDLARDREAGLRAVVGGVVPARASAGRRRSPAAAPRRARCTRPSAARRRRSARSRPRARGRGAPTRAPASRRASRRRRGAGAGRRARPGGRPGRARCRGR